MTELTISGDCASSHYMNDLMVGPTYNAISVISQHVFFGSSEYSINIGWSRCAELVRMWITKGVTREGQRGGLRLLATIAHARDWTMLN